MYCMTGTGMTWDEAFAYVGTVLEQECAEQGVTVAITDPGILGVSLRLLRVGKHNYDARLIKARSAPPRRSHRNRPDACPE